MVIKTPTLRQYDSARLYAFYKSLIELLKRINEPTLATHIIPLETMQEQLDAGYKLSQSNELTAAIKAADEIRDNTFLGIKKCVEAFLLHFDKDKQKAAQLINRNISKYGNLTLLPYAEESAGIDSMLNDWKTNDLVTAFDVLNIADWRKELENVQANFENLYIDRIQSQAFKTAVPISKLRPDAIKTYQTFILILSAFEKITPVTYTPILNQVNELVKKYNDFSRSVTTETPTIQE